MDATPAVPEYRQLPKLATYRNCPTGPAEHAAALHPGNRPGRVALARITPSGWKEQTYTVAELPEVLPAVAGESDVYLSTQRFDGWRRISRLRELAALAVDVDFHRVPELAGSHPMGVLEDALIRLEASKIPAPSLAIASGRGLYLLWLHGPVPRKALPRWNACQRELWNVLKPLGADRGALDAARVLRLIGTKNSKAGLTVEALSDVGDVWEFNELADEVLPMTRAELHDLRIQRAARRPRKRPEAPPQGYTAGTLWEARLSDLQALKRIRWFGPLPAHQRDAWMFVAGVAMSWLAPPVVLTRELFALAREVASWDEREAASRMHAVMKRARMAARKEFVEWNGGPADPRYRFTNSRIIEDLNIEPAEERQMLTIISEDERRRRDRDRDEDRRRRAGAVPRDQYLVTAAQRRTEAARLRSEARSYREIAEVLGVSKSAVIAMLKAAPEGGSKSLRLYGGVAGAKPPAEGGEGGCSEMGGVVEEPSLHHPLGCECLDCSARAPNYVRYARYA